MSTPGKVRGAARGWLEAPAPAPHIAARRRVRCGMAVTWSHCVGTKMHIVTACSLHEPHGGLGSKPVVGVIHRFGPEREERQHPVDPADVEQRPPGEPDVVGGCPRISWIQLSVEATRFAWRQNGALGVPGGARRVTDQRGIARRDMRLRHRFLRPAAHRPTRSRRQSATMSSISFLREPEVDRHGDRAEPMAGSIVSGNSSPFCSSIATRSPARTPRAASAPATRAARSWSSRACVARRRTRAPRDPSARARAGTFRWSAPCTR